LLYRAVKNDYGKIKGFLTIIKRKYLCPPKNNGIVVKEDLDNILE
jgi:hypothetical protein